ncbi:tRNA (adenosine(37)-N6)-dimethylallyltransferase MiaA [Dysgonomonas sp. 511]|uniref:tRNA (adenosine(37)-N6)-dimethylallyltransferase MiaA n=1 Tax=Dysgonomonas sp. 511 TaxID=2302930 RepID=UPI0013D7E2D7|nr:tRNA (adenosine(37)-N6)-dimethylallyltransferase MiaA [Dysgonomonas sp. 511]NDV79009.1 tRNA (adenosine(37)-N6)-dimethylallyltransferase MiaA [Dysgonomonas sp. 511]
MKKLIMLLGPTGVGKTELSINLAEYYKSAIVSADSRQFFRGLEVGTAAPTREQKERVPHFLVGMLDVADYYSASEFEQDAQRIITEQHKTGDVVIASGGSMLYIDALCNGIDEIPTIDDNLRNEVYKLYEEEGLEPIRAQLKVLDPDFYNEVDLKNYKRVIHALEVCLMTGKPYSSFRTRTKKPRPFQVIKIGLKREREELYNRINKRVDEMIRGGLLDEARTFYPQRHLNSLNTVGYKELFKYLDGEWPFDFAIEKIKQNTRIYSRKQMTWFKRDEEINWVNLSEVSGEKALNSIINIIAG